MANTVRIKRSTTTSVPTTLQNAELAYSEVSNKLFIGVGTGGVGGSATSIVAIGGTGAFLDLPTAASTYAPLASPTFTGTVTIPAGASISGYALLASPTFTGTPAAPTATAGTNTTQIATTAFVSTAVSNLVNGAGAALDTLKELADALGNDASFATTISTSLGEKLVKSNNLSDLTSASTARTNLGLGTIATEAAADYLTKAGNLSGLSSASTARTNLGLGTIATQNANNVAITGGTIDGITFDGGSF